MARLFNYLPYKYTIYFESPLRYSKQTLQTKSKESERFFNILKTTEKKSVLDYSYWNNKLLYQINKNKNLIDFEKNFQNSVILSKNNLKLKKALKLLYLRNIFQFNEETKNLILSN